MSWLHMVCEVQTGLSTLPRSLHCLGSAAKFGWFLVGLCNCGGKFSHFCLLDCLLMKTVTSTKESWCTALPIRKTQNQVHCQIEMNRLPSTAATGSKTILHAAHQNPANVDQLNITEVQIEKKNACKSIWTEWTNWTTALNQPNHWIHLTKVRSRNEKFVREEGRPHELSCGYSWTCAIFFAPRPRAYTKIAIFVLQNVPIVASLCHEKFSLSSVHVSSVFSTQIVNRWFSTIRLIMSLFDTPPPPPFRSIFFRRWNEQSRSTRWDLGYKILEKNFLPEKRKIN